MPQTIKRLRVDIEPTYFSPDYIEMRVSVFAGDEVHQYSKAIERGDFESVFDDYMQRAKLEIKHMVANNSKI